MKATKQIIFLLLTSLVVITGCNTNEPQVNEEGTAQAQQTAKKDWAESLLGPGPVNYGEIHDQSHSYNPRTESNVTGTSYRSLDAPRQTEGDDQEMIENVVYAIPKVTPGMVILTGANAWVNIQIEGEPSQEEEDKVIEDVEKQLKQANPRYRYDIVVNHFME
ncbi:hypothetical protein [Salipaludibacillus sp. CF4.18]|uniref:hypothetical protein n=1 Tax=Salipaludibacillus sp. CF4.18 TaxID=3373081 RepID=UPI003EE45FC9